MAYSYDEGVRGGEQVLTVGMLELGCLDHKSAPRFRRSEISDRESSFERLSLRSVMDRFAELGYSATAFEFSGVFCQVSGLKVGEPYTSSFSS